MEQGESQRGPVDGTGGVPVGFHGWIRGSPGGVLWMGPGESRWGPVNACAASCLDPSLFISCMDVYLNY